MVLKKNYYSEEEKLWKEAELELKEHKCEPSPDAGFPSELFKKAEDASVSGGTGEEKFKANAAGRCVSGERFSELINEAVYFAESAPMDITVSSDHVLGQIRMTADCLMIMPFESGKMRKTLSDLISESEYFDIIPKDGNLVEMYFRFSLSQAGHMEP